MNLTECPINFADARGEIRDLFGHDAPDCVTLITSKAGAVRGNHVHARSTQWVYVVSGCLLVFTRDTSASSVERAHLEPGFLLRHPPGVAHAYLATEDTVFLAFAEGIRQGEDYEADTERVPSLVDAWLDGTRK